MTDPPVSAATLTATVREALEMDHSLGQCGLTDDCETCSALAALSVLEQQHADAERLERLNTELTRDYNAMLIEQSKQRNRAEDAEAALQAAHDAIRARCPSCRAGDVAVLVDGDPYRFYHGGPGQWVRCQLNDRERAALAAASAAAEGDDVEGVAAATTQTKDGT